MIGYLTKFALTGLLAWTVWHRGAYRARPGFAAYACFVLISSLLLFPLFWVGSDDYQLGYWVLRPLEIGLLIWAVGEACGRGNVGAVIGAAYAIGQGLNVAVAANLPSSATSLALVRTEQVIGAVLAAAAAVAWCYHRSRFALGFLVGTLFEAICNLAPITLTPELRTVPLWGYDAAVVIWMSEFWKRDARSKLFSC